MRIAYQKYPLKQRILFFFSKMKEKKKSVVNGTKVRGTNIFGSVRSLFRGIGIILLESAIVAYFGISKVG